MFLNFFILSIKGLRHQKLRSWLTILGVVIGIFLVAMMLSLSEGLKTGILNQLRMFGSDLIIIYPGETSNPFLGLIGGLEFREKDLKVLERIEGIDVILPMNIKGIVAEYKGERVSTMLHGNPWQETKIIFERSQGFRLEKGYWPQRGDEKKVILGAKIAKDSFDQEVKVGDEIIIKGRRFEVAGIFSEIGNQMDDTVIYIGMENFRQLTGEKTGVGSLLVQVKSGFDPEMVASDIKYYLGKQKGIEDFVVLTSAKAGNIVGNIMGIVQIAITAIAGIALIVGGVGIMNTMYTSVLERIREIGVMKAVGAKNSQIMTLFLIEASLIGLIGGLIGLIIGLGLAEGIAIFAQNKGFRYLDVSVSPQIIFSLLTFAFLVGIASGVLPARQAAKLKPADALRYE